MDNLCQDTDDLSHSCPLVTVGIPAYNRPEGLRRTLECITGQTYKNLEIIISDNGSPGPETETVVRGFMETDNRIQFYRQEINRGPTFNFRFVLEKATGEYFMWAADDDEWEPQFVSRLLDLLLKYPDMSGAMSGVKIRDDHGTIVRTIRYPILSNPGYNRFRLAFFAAAHDEITFLIYGLYRIGKANVFFKNSDNAFGKDMLIVCDMLLSSKFGYVDEILHIRHVHLKGTAELYEEEEIGKNYRDSLNYLKLLFSFGPYLWRSPTIARPYKFCIPILTLRQGIWVAGVYINRLYQSCIFRAKRYLPLNRVIRKCAVLLKNK